MSGGIRVRRVTEPTAVQRGPAPVTNFEDLSTAWDNHAEAKCALQRAEARLEEAGTYCAGSYSPDSQDLRGILSRPHHTTAMDSLGQVRVPVDRVPSLEIVSRHRSQASNNRYSHGNYGRDRTRKRVTIVDNFDADQRSANINSPPRGDRSRQVRGGPLAPSPSKTIDTAQIQRLEGQLRSLSKSLKSSAPDPDPLRAPARIGYEERPADRSWGGSPPPHGKTYDKSPLGGGPSPSSREILSRGSANLSADSSTAVRVLNDLPPRRRGEEPQPQPRAQRNYEYREEEYVPAYERLYGALPGEKLSDRQEALRGKEADEEEERQREAVRQRLRANRKHFASGGGGGGASDHLERLREKIEQQKSAAVLSKPTSSERVRHREADPVVVQEPDAMEAQASGFAVAASKGTVRKVAAAPVAPAYKGFSEVETRFQLPDGKVVSEENLTRKTSRKRQAPKHSSENHAPASRSGAERQDRALKPSMALQKQNQPDPPAKAARTVRKVHKASSRPAEKRPKRPERHKEVISTTAWREGQKTVLKILGPPPEKPKPPAAKTPAPHSPPTHDTEDLPSGKAADPALGLAPSERTKDDPSESAELSDHPLNAEEADDQETAPYPDLDRLHADAKNVLEDLHLDQSSSDEEGPPSGKEARREAGGKSPLRPTQKSQPARPAPAASELILPAERVRHYDTDKVRSYMARQKAERRRKLLEEKRERKLAQERRQEQLSELRKRQKDSVRLSQRTRGQNTAASQLGETFSKGPQMEEAVSNQLNALDQLSNHHPYRPDGKKMDVTSSDKENKNIWSASSSDSSTPSSLPSLPSDPLHSPSGQAPSNGRDPPARVSEAQDRSPRLSSPIGVVVTQMAGGVAERGQRSTEPGQMAEATQPTTVGFTSKPPLPSSASGPSGISTAARSKADRIQALKATAAALQGKIDSEVKKLTGDVPAAQPAVPATAAPAQQEEPDVWAYPTGARTAGPGRSVHFGGSAVESPAGGGEEEGAEVTTRYQRMVGNDRNHMVFTGSLPGTGSLSAQARLASELSHQEHAATRIQAAYRGHSVRQKLDWGLPSGRTLASCLRVDIGEDAGPKVYVSEFDGHSPLYGRGGSADNESLSEGSLPDSVADDRDYMPTFKSLPTKHSHVGRPAPGPGHRESEYATAAASSADPPPVLARPVSLQPKGGNEWRDSLADGLSVINIYTRKYQNANRAVLYGQLPSERSLSLKNPVIGYSYNDDFTGSASTSPNSNKSRQDLEDSYSADFSVSASVSSRSKAKSKSKSATSSSKGSHKAADSFKRSSRATRSEVTDPSSSRQTDDHTLNLSPNDSFGSSCDDSASRRRVPRTPSPRASLSAHRSSSESHTPPPSLPSPSASHGSSRGPSSPESTLSSGSVPRSPPAPAARSRSPSATFRTQPAGRGKSLPSSASSSSGRSASKSSRARGSPPRSSSDAKPPSSSVSARSLRDQPGQSSAAKASKELAGDQGPERPLLRTVLDAKSPGGAGKPPLPPGQYSPAALSLRMASELTLLESLEESVRQLSEMERTRHVSLAQQESVSLARVLQARQRDHEREIQLLSLKARQEVEEAHKQLEVVRQRAVETASDAERVLTQARREAAEATNENARRLIESQAEAARVTAEAARQLAEAQRTPAQPAVPSYDPGKLASDTATAAASAAVTAALEQQRLQQLDFLKEMKDSMAPAVNVGVAHTRTLGVGDHATLSSRPSSHGSYTSSQPSYTSASSGSGSSSSSGRAEAPPHSPKQDYSDDFSEATAKSRRTADSLSSGTVPDASSLRSASVADRSRSHLRPARSPSGSESIPTASGLSPGARDNSTLSVATESGLSPIKSDVLSPSSRTDSSIRTEFDGGGSGARSPCVAEDLSSGLSPSYTAPSGSSDTRSSKTSATLTPSSTSTPVRETKADVKPRAAAAGARPARPADLSLGAEDDDAFARLSAEMLRQQLRDEEVRAQQQGALFKLREKTLLERAKVELEWLEHEKRGHRESGGAEALQAVRKKQQALVARVQREQAEMRRLRVAQKAASHERQLLLYQQQEILRMRQATEAVKDHMKDLSSVSLASSIAGDLAQGRRTGSRDVDVDDDIVDVVVDDVSAPSSPELPSMGLSDSADSLASPIAAAATLAGRGAGSGSGDERDGGAKTAAEKQAQVMMKLKRMQQPLSMKYLTKREQQLSKRRRNAQELLAWQRRLDEEESQIVHMEREAMRRLDDAAATATVAKPRPPMKALPSALPSGPASRADSAHTGPSSALGSDSAAAASAGVTTTATSTSTSTGSPREEDSSGLTEGSGRRASGSSVAEDLSRGSSSSVPEEVASEPSPITSTPRRGTASTISSDDTLKHSDSIPEDYGSEAFESADHTLTPSARSPAAGSSSAAAALAAAAPAVPRSSQFSTPSGLESLRAPLSPHRRIMESESGSESEKSFSQTVSEIASDQSDIEGRVKALESELRKRKTEAEKLRRQQKRMQREKLKAQEASLKKQLESYDKLIEKTKSELRTESESAAKSAPLAVKPQIKQLRVSESQRLKDRSHSRSLRQRTASESSREGGAAELGGPMRKRRSASEGSVSSRSSQEEESGLRREPSYASSSSVFTPPTTPHHVEDTTPSPQPRRDSLSQSPSAKLDGSEAEASISEEVHEELATSSGTSEEDSQRALTPRGGPASDSSPRQGAGPQRREEMEEEEEEGRGESPIGSEVSEDIPSAYSSVSAAGAGAGPRGGSPDDTGASIQDRRSEQSDASEVPEEVYSEFSSHSQDSVRSASPKAASPKAASPEERPSGRESDGVLSPETPAKRPSILPAADELSQRSEHSCSSSARSVSSSHRTRTQSERSGASYSDDFFESSVSIGVKSKESPSDTDDDVSEQLSVASEPSEPSVALGGPPPAFSLTGQRPTAEEAERGSPESPAEVTVSEEDAGEKSIKSEIASEDEARTPLASPPAPTVLEVSQDFTGYEIGDRMAVSGKGGGTLLFKGLSHFAPGMWGGVELDSQRGTNDGSLDGHVYFRCRAGHGIFVPADQLQQLPADRSTAEAESRRDSSIGEEELSSVASEVSEKEQRKPDSRPASSEEEEKEGEGKQELSPMSSLSSKTPSEPIKPLALALKSEATDEDSVAEDLTEPVTDDAALAALINSAAAAVESFNEDDMDEIFSAQTPRGPPETADASPPSKERLVDSITDHLTRAMVKDSVKAMGDAAEQQTSRQDQPVTRDAETSSRAASAGKPAGSLLEMLVTEDVAEAPAVAGEEKKEAPQDEETRKGVIKRKIDSSTQILLGEAIGEMMALRNKRAKRTDAEEEKAGEEDAVKTPPKTPSPETPCASPFVRNATPYTPDSDSPALEEDTTLDDDIFINRVRIETNGSEPRDQDQLPVARPGSPVFGESSGINPEALSERLQQMQQPAAAPAAADIFEGDLFGEQEWFDDDFGSMPKSKSIIQVPPPRSQESPAAAPAGVRTPPVPGTPEPGRLDLTRIVQEPFYAVPHNRRDVRALAAKSVQVVHAKAALGERTAGLSPPPDVLGEDSKGSDVESTSRKAYKHLVFDLVGEAYRDITSEQEAGEQLPWTKAKRRPRRYFFDRPPRRLEDIGQVVEDRALFVAGLSGRPRPDPALGRFGKKKKDHVDEILTLELREEEQEWVNYDDDELAVKMQLTEAIFDSLLVDTAMVLNRIQDRRRARASSQTHPQPQPRPEPQSEPEIEF